MFLVWSTLFGICIAVRQRTPRVSSTGMLPSAAQCRLRQGRSPPSRAPQVLGIGADAGAALAPSLAALPRLARAELIADGFAARANGRRAVSALR